MKSHKIDGVTFSNDMLQAFCNARNRSIMSGLPADTKYIAGYGKMSEYKGMVAAGLMKQYGKRDGWICAFKFTEEGLRLYQLWDV